MEKELKGWKPVREVEIPPVNQKGFQEDVMIRRPVKPVQNMETPTVLLQDVEKQEEQGEKTVLLNRPPMILRGFVRRLSTGEETEIHTYPFIIGTSEDCDFAVRDNVTISRHHAQILKMGTSYFLQDMGSLNHTFIEDHQVKERAKLTKGMIFRLSDEEFAFRAEIGQKDED